MGGVGGGRRGARSGREAESGRGVGRGRAPLAVVDFEAGEVKVHDFALELEWLVEGVRGDDGGGRHGHGGDGEAAGWRDGARLYKVASAMEGQIEEI